MKNGHFWHFCMWHPIFNVQYGDLKMLQLPQDFLEISGIGPRLLFMFCFKRAIHSYWMSQVQTSNFWFFEAFFQISTPIWEPKSAPNATKLCMDKRQSRHNVLYKFYGSTQRTRLSRKPHFLLLANFLLVFVIFGYLRVHRFAWFFIYMLNAC